MVWAGSEAHTPTNRYDVPLYVRVQVIGAPHVGQGETRTVECSGALASLKAPLARSYGERILGNYSPLGLGGVAVFFGRPGLRFSPGAAVARSTAGLPTGST